MTRTLTLIALTAVLILGACGGSSSSTPPSPTTDPTFLDACLRHYDQDGTWSAACEAADNAARTSR